MEMDFVADRTLKKIGYLRRSNLVARESSSISLSVASLHSPATSSCSSLENVASRLGSFVWRPTERPAQRVRRIPGRLGPPPPIRR
jgi:hypothetical protein